MAQKRSELVYGIYCQKVRYFFKTFLSVFPSSGYSDEEYYDADERVAPTSPANGIQPVRQAWEVEEDPDYVEREDVASEWVWACPNILNNTTATIYTTVQVYVMLIDVPSYQRSGDW